MKCDNSTESSRRTVIGSTLVIHAHLKLELCFSGDMCRSIVNAEKGVGGKMAQTGADVFFIRPAACLLQNLARNPAGAWPSGVQL